MVFWPGSARACARSRTHRRYTQRNRAVAQVGRFPRRKIEARLGKYETQGNHHLGEFRVRHGGGEWQNRPAHDAGAGNGNGASPALFPEVLHMQGKPYGVNTPVEQSQQNTRAQPPHPALPARSSVFRR